MDLMGELLTNLGRGLIRRRVQMEVIHRHRCSRQPHPQCFPERSGGVNDYDMNSEAPFQWSVDQPRTDVCVVAAIDNTQDLAGIEVNDGAHQCPTSLA